MLLLHLDIIRNGSYPFVANDFPLGTQMKHQFDVKKLSQRIDLLFKSLFSKTKEDGFMAPYFPLVQSSGMGKTKLMYEYKQHIIAA